MSGQEDRNNDFVGLDRLTEKIEDRRNAKADARAEGQLKGQKARGWAEKLLTRASYGAIYALLTVGCIFWGRIPTTVLIALMAWLCCSEFFQMSRLGGRMPNELFGLVAALLFPFAAYLRGFGAMLFVAFALLVACAIWFVFTPRATIGDVAITFFGPVYTSMTFSCAVLLRGSFQDPAAALVTIGAIGSIWANDAVAYLVGSRIGKHPLAPRISPKKSWEGFVAGLIGSMIVWLILGFFSVGGITLPVAVVCGALVGFMGVIGDLFESRLKRGVGVKDSGTLMPGHGGMLDRSDSLLFGLVTCYCILLLGGIL